MKEIMPADAKAVHGGSTGRQTDEHLLAESTEAKSPVEIDYSPLPEEQK